MSRFAAVTARAIAIEGVRCGDVRATRDTFGEFWAKVLEAKRPYVTEPRPLLSAHGAGSAKPEDGPRLARVGAAGRRPPRHAAALASAHRADRMALDGSPAQL